MAAVDSVCKVGVDESNPPGGKAEHMGTTYYFCGPGCKEAFEKNPGQYTQGHGGSNSLLFWGSLSG